MKYRSEEQPVKRNYQSPEWFACRRRLEPTNVLVVIKFVEGSEFFSLNSLKSITFIRISLSTFFVMQEYRGRNDYRYFDFLKILTIPKSRA